MSKIKKEKYIRDLFEENFAEKFFLYISMSDKITLIDRFKKTRDITCNNLLSGINFVDAPLVLFDVIDDREKFTIRTFDKILFDIEFRELLYCIFEYKEKISMVFDKEKSIEIQNAINKMINTRLNKTIENYIVKNSDLFIFNNPSRSGIVLSTLLIILNNIIELVQKKFNPRYRKERTSQIIEERSTLYAYEYDEMQRLAQIYNKLKAKSKFEYKNFNTIDLIRYSTAMYAQIEIDDERLEFIINNSTLSKQEIGFKYIKEKYNITQKSETLDKLLDRARKKRKNREENAPTMMSVDSYLLSANQLKLNPDQFANKINLFRKELKLFLIYKN